MNGPGVARTGGELEPAEGAVLDAKYRLVSRLGRGGFGDVWRAQELLPDGAPFREVALKLLGSTELDAHDWAEEAKLLASFRHPSLVTIYAAGILGEKTRFVAMELLEGHNLNDVLRARGRIPWRRVLRWAHHVASALDVIHARGVVHLDLKPANVFLSDDGAIKVLDFGIARRAGEPVSWTPGRLAAELGATLAVPTGGASHGPDDALAATRRATRALDASGRAVVGTPGFIAPEVLEAREPTQAADAFALGVCIAQLATGRLPHDAPDEPTSWDDASAVSTWLQALREAATRGAVRPLVPDLPRGAADLVARLLAADPDLRGAPAGQLAALVEEAIRRPYGVPDPPYPGLVPFGPEAEGTLFGRDEDIARLGRELCFEASLVLQGAGGVGKTSLARAGLVPHLAHAEADAMDDWRLVEVAPGDDPDAALAEALARIDPGLADAGADALAAHAAKTGIGLCLLVDRLDAVASAAEAKRARIEALGVDLGGSLRRGVRLVATIDEERTAFALTTSLGSALRAGFRFVGAPAAAAARDVALGPARLAGAEIRAPDVVVGAVERELRAGPNRVPIVALALAAFWSTRERRGLPAPPAELQASRPPSERPPAPRASSPSTPVVEHHSSGKVVIRTGSSRVEAPGSGPRFDPASRGGPTAVLDGARFRELGGVRGALARHADATLAALDPQARVLAERLLLRLTGTDGTSRPWPEAELLGACGAASAPVLDALEARQLVARRGGTVTIAHEALISGWPRLAALLLSHMEELALVERLRDAAAAWDRADRHPDFLLHGALLAEVRARSDLDKLGLGERETALVGASLGAARRRRVLRIAAIVVGVVLVAAGVVGARALDVARKAEEDAKNAAVELEYVNELAAKSRRADDAYGKVAFASDALSRGSPDAALPLDIALAASRVPRADVLTLERVVKPEFFWDDRWLVAEGASGDLVVADFHPPGVDVIEDVDIDADADVIAASKRAKVSTLRPHAEPIAEKAAFGFDTSFVTRSVSGEVKVHRLREDGSTALVAVAPMRCVGAVHVARDAPVVVCASPKGVTRWDLRRAAGDGDHEWIRFPGAVEDVSADGATVVAKLGRQVAVWRPEAKRDSYHEAPYAVAFVRLSPDGRSVAVVSNVVEVLDATEEARVLFTSAPLGLEPQTGRWDARGADFGLCTSAGRRRWIYLRHGGRASDDAAPGGDPCRAPRRGNEPESFGRDDAPDDLRAVVPEHFRAGGFKLPNRRVLTRDLVVLDPSHGGATRLLRFRAHDELGQEEDEGDAARGPSVVEREGSALAAQVGDEIRVYALADEARYFTRHGRIVRKCPDGRLLALQNEDVAVRVFDVWTGRTEGFLTQAPSFVIGADGRCSTVYTQKLDGSLVAHALRQGDRALERVVGQPDGYVFASRPAQAGKGLGQGLWLAVSSGAIAHVEDETGAVRVVGRVARRATAIADGPGAGEVSVAHPSGVSILDVTGRERKVLESFGDPWEDLAPNADGASMLLASPRGVAVLDTLRKEITGFSRLARSGRFSAWDDDGSVFVWSDARTAGVEGVVVPRNRALARAAAALLSNIEVQGGRLVARR